MKKLVIIMNNKILINVFISSTNQNYDIYIPVNERIINVIKGLSKLFDELTEANIDKTPTNHILINRDTGRQYSLEQIVIDTDIKNGTKLLFL